MKKRVLLYLVMIVSLAAIAYSAAITNPGHGVEEIGSGSSPYAPFRDWNVVELGYEDQYSGPSALKGNVFWLGTINAETIAAQNPLGDWCAIQIHPSGIYMNCYNNASNMTLYNSYYWNGTHYIKNDTIKEGPVVKEQKILGAGQNGGQEVTTITGSGGNKAGSSIQANGVVTASSIEVINTATGTGATSQVLLDGGNGVATMIGENTDGTTVTSVSSDGNTGTTTTTGTDGTSTGETKVSPGEVKASANNGAGTGGEITTGTTGASTDFNFLGITVSSSDWSYTANGGTVTTTTDNTGRTAQNIFTMDFTPAGDGFSSWSVENNAGNPTASIALTASTVTGNGAVIVTAPTMQETVTGGNFMTHVGELDVLAGSPPVMIPGADLAVQISFAPGMPTCVEASRTWVPGAGVSFEDIDVLTGAPCGIPSIKTFAFFAILND